MTDRGLKALANGCVELRSLNLWVCAAVSNSGVVHIAHTCRHLAYLDLRLCTKVSGTAVEAVASCCPSLTAIYLERAGRITDESVARLAAGCTGLALLDLGWCEIGDLALEALAAHCAGLHTLNLAYCEAVVDVTAQHRAALLTRSPASHVDLPSSGGILSLCEGCTNLQSLDIGGCARLTEGALRAVAMRCARRRDTTRSPRPLPAPRSAAPGSL